jgi:N-acetyl-anhydromuramyl-L-alanine amidase AmpD
MNIVRDHVWKDGSVGAYRRTKPVRLVAWHWTGGKTSESCIRTLKSRGLSIHYTIDHDGTIREHADPAKVVAQHVGRVVFPAGRVLSVNAESIGIEIAHKGFAPSFEGESWKREEYSSTVHGRRVKLLRFTNAQIEAARWLARHLSETFKIPLALPLDERGELVRGVLEDDEMHSFRGHAGHFHFEAKKSDPGPELLAELVR